MPDDVRSRAVLWPKGRLFEDFEVGQHFDHHWGRTITEADALLFASLTMAYNPIYFNRAFALAEGHSDIVVCPQLVFNIALGLSVEDCSEIGGPFLGVFELEYHRAVYPGTTVIASSETVDVRTSESNPANGIVTWRTKGATPEGEALVSFRRSNLVRLRNAPGGQ
ncbi:MaoC family dehydratase [Novosphingobium sp. 9U]|uniref:MaoC family dehydratase n=1 Tax=Novosphingobium sp. 9U TaxID=2653158 RepID=UPI0012F26089|nr:MaoC family dehydratase [Novosphingobium sp. 9U]VWX50589.1 Dehydratase [Novosphingobium sp. 9U]